MSETIDEESSTIGILIEQNRLMTAKIRQFEVELRAIKMRLADIETNVVMPFPL